MKKLFFTLAVAAMAFTACEVDNDTAHDLMIRATVTDASDDLVKVTAASAFSGVRLGTVSFTNGGFTMTLPAIPPAEALESMNPLKDLFEDYIDGEPVNHFPGEIDISDPDAQYFRVYFGGADNKNYLIGDIQNRDANNNIYYWYVDRNVTIKGAYTNYGTFTYDLTFRKGWNRILESIDGATTTTISASCGTDTGWIFTLTPAPN